MKSKAMLMALALAGMMDSTLMGQPFGSSPDLTKEDYDELLRIAKANRDKRLLQKGCKEFFVEGISVIALNEKNAIRKVKNIQKQIN